MIRRRRNGRGKFSAKNGRELTLPIMKKGGRNLGSSADKPYVTPVGQSLKHTDK